MSGLPLYDIWIDCHRRDTDLPSPCTEKGCKVTCRKKLNCKPVPQRQAYQMTFEWGDYNPRVVDAGKPDSFKEKK